MNAMGRSEHYELKMKFIQRKPSLLQRLPYTFEQSFATLRMKTSFITVVSLSETKKRLKKNWDITDV